MLIEHPSTHWWDYLVNVYRHALISLAVRSGTHGLSGQCTVSRKSDVTCYTSRLMQSRVSVCLCRCQLPLTQQLQRWCVPEGVAVGCGCKRMRLEQPAFVFKLLRFQGLCVTLVQPNLFWLLPGMTVLPLSQTPKWHAFFFSKFLFHIIDVFLDRSVSRLAFFLSHSLPSGRWIFH